MNVLKSCRFLAMMAVVVGSLITTVPAFAQQDVDPTWYNPWSPTTTAAQPAKPKPVINRKQAKAKTESPRTMAKARTKHNRRSA